MYLYLYLRYISKVSSPTLQNGHLDEALPTLFAGRVSQDDGEVHGGEQEAGRDAGAGEEDEGGGGEEGGRAHEEPAPGEAGEGEGQVRNHCIVIGH